MTGSVGAPWSPASPQPCTMPPPLVWAATWGQEGQEGARVRIRVRATARVVESNASGDGIQKTFDAAQSYINEF